MRLLPCGDHALLIDGLNPADRRALAETLRADSGRERGVLDAIPGASTLLVHCASPTARAAVAAWLPHLEVQPDADVVGEEAPLTIETVYDGADLADVADHLGWSIEKVRQWHTGQEWVVDFAGFVPGFGYLSPTRQALDLPRRPSPRTHVPAGAVGLASTYSGVYPRDSSGGWQLIGRTSMALWDATRAQPALLRPGRRIRFRALETAAPPIVEAVRPQPLASPAADAVVHVTKVGALATIQDLGRAGHACVGVTGAGAIDRYAFALANRLLGNPDDTAGVELLLGNLSLTVTQPCVVSVTGAPLAVSHNAKPAAFGQPLVLRDGDTLELGTPVLGLWSYLAIRGGIAAPRLLGSCSSSPSAGVGPAPLRPGDHLELAQSMPSAFTLGETLTGHERIGTTRIGLIPGPREDWFTPESLSGLWTGPWQVTSDIDRVGMRLTGPVLQRVSTRELASEGVVRGSVQVSPRGELIVFLADHPTTGGYPVVGVVADADLDRLAQSAPGSTLHFRRAQPLSG